MSLSRKWETTLRAAAAPAKKEGSAQGPRGGNRFFGCGCAVLGNIQHSPMIRVFVSGCYDILHAGHVQFFREARALGDHLTVCFASTEVLWLHKRRRSSLPDDHKAALLAALEVVDDVVLG